VFSYSNILSLALGLASALGFAPVDLWPITFIALACLLHIVSKAPTLKAALARGYWFAVGHFTVGLNWIAGAFQFQDAMPHWLGWVAVVGLSFFLALYPAMAAGLAWRWGRKGLPFVLIFAAGWIVTEYLRATLFTGFAWNPLGVVALSFGSAAQLIGTYGLSGLILMLSGSFWLLTTRHFKQGSALFAFVALTGGIGFASKQIAGVETLQANERTGYPAGPLIRIVQPNIAQQDKHNDAFNDINFEKLRGLTGKATAESRLILWPEAAIPEFLDEPDSEAADARTRISALLGPQDILLTGGMKLHFRRERHTGYYQDILIGARNSLWVMNAKGQLLGRYDKAHLVPGGEYLPMKPIMTLLGLSRLVPGSIDFWEGPGPRTLALPGFGKVGAQICYEIIFSGQVVDRTNRPDFLFNPSNDAWFGAWGPPQHLAQARLRAIEEGLPIIRSTPTGISAVIDADGSVLHQLPYKKAGYIETRLPPPHLPTLFARYGNILSLALAFILGVLGVALGRKQR
jgi:apolipoprotein N-acyltransferase